MNINVFLGLFIAFAAIFFGSPDVRNDIMVYLRADAFILVFFGTVGSTMIGSSFKDLKNMLKVLVLLFVGRQQFYGPEKMVETLVDISEKAQSMSKQMLPELVRKHNDPELKRGIEMVGAGLEKDFILQTLDTDVAELSSRHQKMQDLVSKMGSFAPMFGMAGTVMGVIQVLKNVSDIDNIVSGMALALLTTLYGLFFSSILFIPLANKLSNLSRKEVLAKEIMTEGIGMIYDQEIPLKVSKYLTAFLHTHKKGKLEKS